MTMPNLIDDMVTEFQKLKLDYLSNCIPPTYPDGLDIEVVNTKEFLKLSSYPMSDRDREHVTPAIYNNPSRYRIENYYNRTDLSSKRWTVDYEEDFEYVRGVFSEFKGKETVFDIDDVLKLEEEKPTLENSLGSEFRNLQFKNE